MARRQPTSRPPGKLTSGQTVALAAAFTAAMLGIAYLLVRFGVFGGDEDTPAGATTLLIKTEPTTAAPGEPTRLSARVVDGQGRPVAGFALTFFINDQPIGRAVTDERGRAHVEHAFASAGRHWVDVAPAHDEPRDFQVINRPRIEVSVVEPPPPLDRPELR